MPVFIRMMDGMVKEYPVGSPFVKDYLRSKCGETNCEHLDCAIEYAKEMATVMRLIFSVMILMTCSLTFIILLIVFFQWSGIINGVFWAKPENILSIVLIVGICSLIFYFRYQPRQTQKNLEELLEFKERGTVNTLPARQVSVKTAKEDQH